MEYLWRGDTTLIMKVAGDNFRIMKLLRSDYKEFNINFNDDVLVNEGWEDEL